MFTLILSEKFEKLFLKIKEKNIRKQIWNKILELEKGAPLGKKLKGNPFWSIHINKYRVIYKLEALEVVILEVLQRKHDYREL